MHKRMSPHGGFDHMGEAINLINNFKVEKVIFNCGPHYQQRNWNKFKYGQTENREKKCLKT